MTNLKELQKARRKLIVLIEWHYYRIGLSEKIYGFLVSGEAGPPVDYYGVENGKR